MTNARPDKVLEEIIAEFDEYCDNVSVDRASAVAWIEELFDENVRPGLESGALDWSDDRLRKFVLNVTSGTTTAARLEAERTGDPITGATLKLVWSRLAVFWQQINPLPEIAGVMHRSTTRTKAGDVSICSCPK